MRKNTYKIPAIGSCEVCKKENVNLTRTYFHYDNIKCSCHSPNHFIIIEHCDTCVPVEPDETKIHIKTKDLDSPIDKLSISLRDDEAYYTSWKSNIAMAFYDVFANKCLCVPNTEIRELSNKAADNFLQLLIYPESKSAKRNKKIEKIIGIEYTELKNDK